MTLEQEARLEVLTQLKAVGIRVGLPEDRIYKNAARSGFQGTATDIADACAYLRDKNLVAYRTDLTNRKLYRINSAGIDYLEQSEA